MNSDDFKLGYADFNDAVAPISLTTDYLEGWFYAFGMRLAEDGKPLYTGDAIVQGYGYGIYLEKLRSK